MVYIYKQYIFYILKNVYKCVIIIVTLQLEKKPS